MRRSSFLALTLSLLSVPAAWAHAHPKVMVPAADSTGPTPAKIIVTFSEPVEAKFSSLVLTTEKGEPVSKEKSEGDPSDPKTLKLTPPSLTAGDYLVHWTSVAPDGHKMQGEYKFTVK